MARKKKTAKKRHIASRKKGKPARSGLNRAKAAIRISRGLKRYWRTVKAIKGAKGVSLKKARKIHKRERIKAEKTRKKIKEGKLPIGWTPEHGGEALSFTLRDQHPEVPGMFPHNTTVRMIVHTDFTEDRDTESIREDHEIEFNTGASDDEFWSNYYHELREWHDEARAEYAEEYYDGDTSEAYDHLSFSVGSIA